MWLLTILMREEGSGERGETKERREARVDRGEGRGERGEIDDKESIICYYFPQIMGNV